MRILPMLLSVVSASTLVQSVALAQSRSTDVVVMRRSVAPPQVRPVVTPTPTPTPTASPTPSASPTPTPTPGAGGSTPTPAQTPGTWTTTEWVWDAPTKACLASAPRHRTAVCTAGGTTVDDARCSGEKPVLTGSAQRLDGCLIDWSVGAYTNWSSSCNSAATRTRVVRCQASGGDFPTLVLADSYCTTAKPKDKETAAILDTCNGSWQTTWTNQGVCTGGVQNQVVTDSTCESRNAQGGYVYQGAVCDGAFENEVGETRAVACQARRSICEAPVANSTVTGYAGFQAAGVAASMAEAVSLCETNAIRTTACYIDNRTAGKFAAYVMSAGSRASYSGQPSLYVANCRPQ